MELSYNDIKDKLLSALSVLNPTMDVWANSIIGFSGSLRQAIRYMDQLVLEEKDISEITLNNRETVLANLKLGIFYVPYILLKDSSDECKQICAAYLVFTKNLFGAFEDEATIDVINTIEPMLNLEGKLIQILTAMEVLLGRYENLLSTHNNWFGISGNFSKLLAKDKEEEENVHSNN